MSWGSIQEQMNFYLIKKVNHLFEKFHIIYFNWFLQYPVTGGLSAVIIHQPYTFMQTEFVTLNN